MMGRSQLFICFRHHKINCFLIILTLTTIIFTIISWLMWDKERPENYILSFNVNDDRNFSNSKCWISCVERHPTDWSKLWEKNLTNAANTDVDFTNNSNNISGFSNPIVPDIVHLIYFGKNEIDFVQMICIRSIVDNHNPSVILLHCSDCDHNSMKGKYWHMLGEKYRKVIQIVKAVEPKYIFGQKITFIQHASDIARIGILMKYGGIYLDNDVYVVRGLHGFRHYEMALPWDEGLYLGTQVLAAHKDARFLKHWMDSYHNYKKNEWYFNAGQFPTTSILYKRPELVHRVKLLFGVHMELAPQIYHANWPEWTNQYTIHLLIRHRHYLDKESEIKIFDEINVKMCNNTFGQMMRLTLYGTTNLIE